MITITSCLGKTENGNSHSSSSNDSGQYKFVCEEDNKHPTTFVVTPDGQKRTFIQWKSDFFNQLNAEEKYPPERRCREVTNRMNTYIQSGSPRYVTHGTINLWPVICITDQKGSDCKELIYTLKDSEDPKLKKENQDPEDRLREFLGLARNNFKGDPLVESPSCRTYIEIKALMEGKLDKAEVICTGQR